MGQSIFRIADSTTVLVLSRLSMVATPFLIALIGFLGVHYLDTRFALQNAAIEQNAETLNGRVAIVEEAVEDAATQIVVVANRVTALDNRTTGIEAARTEARRAADMRNDQVLARLDRLEQALLEISKQIASQAAVMQTMRP